MRALLLTLYQLPVGHDEPGFVRTAFAVRPVVFAICNVNDPVVRVGKSAHVCDCLRGRR